MIANFLIPFAVLVVFLAILTTVATMLSSSISDAEERYESMEVDASPAEITEPQGQSETNPVDAISSGLAEVGDPEIS